MQCQRSQDSRILADASGKKVSSVDIYYNTEEDPIAFSADDLELILMNMGAEVTMNPISSLPDSPSGTFVIIAETSPELQEKLAAAGGIAIGSQGEQDYALRVTQNDGIDGYWALGGDRIGAMYGGIHIGEIIAGGSLANFKDEDKTPYIRKRGLKFNIPLDRRTPSFDDGGVAANTNRKNVWDINFWKEYFDVIARQRYNVLSVMEQTSIPFTGSGSRL